MEKGGNNAVGYGFAAIRHKKIPGKRRRRQASSSHTTGAPQDSNRECPVPQHLFQQKTGRRKRHDRRRGEEADKGLPQNRPSL